MDKEYKKFVTAFIIQLIIIGVMVVLMILANQQIIPPVFQSIALVCVIITAISFNIFAGKYKKR